MITIQKGLKDVLPKDSYRWHYVEEKAREIAARFGFNEIRTPTFEATELFLRGVGETTDIVGKEMYTFLDKGNRSVTLKPEGTAGVARAFIENGMMSDPMPAKMYYITPVFRYEKPQSGRLREHHQFGVELYGSVTPAADFEVIALDKTLIEELGVKGVTLRLNSIGCPECRKKYHEALRAFYRERLSEMCADCKERFEKNPLRMLDCKQPRCIDINKSAPKTLDYLCDDCKAHQDELERLLKAANIDYVVDPKIVRGLDYYTRTVFEFVADIGNFKGTVSGGGRYNHLVEEVGGKPTPAVGFGMGLERLLIAMEESDAYLGEKEIPRIYIVDMGEKAAAIALAAELRKKGVTVDFDVMGRSLKAQMNYANKRGYPYLVVIGSDEISAKTAKLKNMRTGEETPCRFDQIAELLK